MVMFIDVKGASRRNSVINHDRIVATMRNDARASETTWQIQWSTKGKKGLVIKEAWFQKDKKQAPLKILGRTGLSDIFVPYASGSPRIWDLAAPRPGDGLNQVHPAHVGPGGQVLHDPAGRPVAVIELQDRGLSWRNDTDLVRGRQVMV